MTLPRSISSIALVALSACGPDETQSSPAAAMTTADSEPATVPASASAALHSCFDNTDGFRVNHDGSVVDASGQRLIRLPLYSESDDLAASSEDFCGKWASEAQVDAGSYHYVFRTNPDCPRRALPGQFVHLGFHAGSAGSVELVRNFIACGEEGDNSASSSGEREKSADDTILVFDQSTRN